MQALLKKLNKINVKIDLVDEKLNIQAPKGVVTEDLLNEIKSHKNELIKFISLYKNENNKTSLIPKAPKQPNYELSSSQRRMWLLNQFEKESTVYNMPSVFELKGFISVHFLEIAFLALIERHESLRTLFKENEFGEIRQIILDIEEAKFQLQYEEIHNHENNLEKLKSIIHNETNFSFDLSSDSLLRAKLIKTSNDTYAFVCVMHHIISDGWSAEVMINELFTLYDFYANELVIPLDPLQIQYKDFAVWQQNQLKNKSNDEHKNYWIKRFNGEIPVLDLPGYQARPIVKTYNGNVVKQVIGNDFYKAFQTLCKSQDSTLFMGLLSVVNVLFHKYTRQNDIIIGSPIAGRENVELQNQIGFYVNTLALRTQFDGYNNFIEVLSTVKDIVLDAYEHQVYPFDELIDILDIKRDISRNPLFDVVVTLQNKDNSNGVFQKSNSLKIKELQLEENTISKFDLEFAFIENDNNLSLALTYNTDIYDYDFVKSILGHFAVLLEDIVKLPETSIRSLNYLTSVEKHALLYDFNDTYVAYNTNKTVIDLFEEQAAKTPNNIAIVFENVTLTYEQLNQKANQIGSYLRNNYHIQAGDFIGVKLHRSNNLIISILGILKSGAAYIPIDPNYPQDRIDYIESDSNIKVLIDQNELELIYREIGTYSTSNIEKINTSNDLAYAIYTSGTTGNPKGVLIEHKSLINLCNWHINEFDVNESSRGTLFSGVGFDASVWEIFPYLIKGSSLFPINDEGIRFDSKKLIDFYKDNEISHSYMPTAICNDLINMEISIDNIKLLVGGEALVINKKSKLEIYNNYGPTENTVVSTFCKVDTNKTGIVSIGRPVSNTQIYILDEQNQPLPVGISGKIYVSGAGISRGYLNMPELTAEKFTNNPFVENTLIYETGDLGRWRADRSIEFLGRNDFQVKIRGHRIELGEIESVLLSYSPLITQAVVATQEQNEEKVLVAYFVCQGKIDKADLRIFLQKELPDYMIPNFYIEMERIPLTANGKVDRKALPSISESDIIRREYVAPFTDQQVKLARIWQEILQVERVGITDNFFELGGHSLIIVQVINHVFKELGKSLSFKDFFSNPTIEGICNKLEESTFVSIPKAPEALSYPLTSTQKQLWILSQFEGGSVAYNIPVALKIKGAIDIDILEKSFCLLIDRHEILRTSFNINEKGIVEQFILDKDSVNCKIDKVDFTGELYTESKLLNYIHSKSNEVFDLQTGVLIKNSLIKTDDNEFILFFSMHHIIGDGKSLEIIVKDILHFYKILINNAKSDIQDLKIQYKDFVLWKNSKKDAYIKSEQYWMEKFSGELPILNVESSKKRPLIKTFNGNKKTVQFSTEFSTELKGFAKKHDVTLFMTLLSGINVLLYTYSEQHDIIIGTPLAGRDHPDLEKLIGLFLNILPIRTTIDINRTFNDLLTDQKNNLLSSFEHQNYPLNDLIEKLNLDKDNSRAPLFDVMMSLNVEDKSYDYDFDAFEIEAFEFKRQASQFDLNFVFNEFKALELTIEYNTDIFEEFEIDRIFKDFEKIMTKVFHNSDLIIKEFKESNQEIKKRNLNKLSNLLKK